jgi:S1-C subfamily serine protease
VTFGATAHSIALAISTLLAAAAQPASAAELPDTIQRVKSSVVAVGTYQRTRNPPFNFRGTGFVVADGTLIATNAHVLPEQVKTDTNETIVVVAVGAEPQPREAKIVRVDAAHDMAVLRITGTPLPALALDSGDVREGQVFAFTGFPIGSTLGFIPVTHRAMISSITPIALPSATAAQLDTKVIQCIRRGTFPIFQLDATAYPGNSGSPLYALDTASVVGILNMVFVKGTREATLSQPSGITFAVPVTYLRQLLDAIK